MPIMALNPAISFIKNNVFTERTLSEIQTAITSLNLVVMLGALLAAFIVTRGIMSKKAVVISGLFIFGATGLAALILHDRFWNIWLFSVLLGLGSGFFVSTLTSVLFDSFSEKELRTASGLQASAVNVGGIAYGALGGILTTVLWYGGYLLVLVALPVAVLAIFAIPGKKAHIVLSETRQHGTKTKMPLDVFYYSLITFLFFMIYIACGTNISTHLSEANIGNPAIAGMASAIQMAGGVTAGLFFGKLSTKFKDMLLPMAFLIVFVGLTILNVGQASLTLNFLGVFIVGLSLSLVFPQCIFAASQYVDSTNSSAATSLVQAIAPGIGGFVSPLILTNLTIALGGESTQFRYQFVGFFALALAALFYVCNRVRARRILPTTNVS